MAWAHELTEEVKPKTGAKCPEAAHIVWQLVEPLPVFPFTSEDMLARRTVWLSGSCLAVLFACGENSPGPAGMGTGAMAAAGAAGAAQSGAGQPGGGASSTAGNGTGASAGAVAAGSGGTPGAGGTPACPASEGLKVTRLETTSIAQMGEPFDSNADDTSPWGWETNYGKPPEIVALPDGEHVDVLWQDHSGDVGNNQDDPNKNAKKAFVVRLEKGAAGYAVTRAYQIDQMAHIMGLARDEAGNYFVATGVDEDEDLTPTAPAEGEHRSGIVKVVKFDVNGCKSLEIDSDDAREAADPESEPVINPMVAATSRLAYQGGQLALLHGINTGYDAGVDARHQKALTTHFDAATGAVTRTDSMWVSHSFDQRLFWDGSGFVELHLGDAYPRAIALGRFNAGNDGTDSYELFKVKGETGDNNTFTRLGGIAPIAAGDMGYLVVFSTERGTQTSERLNGTRDVAFLRVARGFADMDADGSAYVDGSSTLDVTLDGDPVSNKLSWLTDYAAETAQADRPRVAAIGGDQFVVLWERWTGASEQQNAFVGTQGLVLGGDGLVKQAAKQISALHLLRSDDVVTVGSQALLVTGDGSAKKLTLNLIGADLALQAVEIP